MRTMTITGLSNEQDFITGQSLFILIINKEIRIPVSKDLATQIIQEMYQDESLQNNEQDSIPDQSDSSIDEDEDGIDQI